MFYRSDIQPSKLKYQDCLSTKTIDEDFAAAILNASFELLNQVLQFWHNWPSSAEIVLRLKEEFIPKLQAQAE